jgi:hypothetical protein
VKDRDDERDHAEYRIAKQVGREQTRLAQHGLQAGIACKCDRRELDREIAQIECVADADEAHDQQPLHLIGRQPKRSFFHAPNMVGNAQRDNPRRRLRENT